MLLAQRRVVLRLLRRGADLAGEVVGQALVALVDLGLDTEVPVELLGDALVEDSPEYGSARSV
ncbi:hypothetical protein [Streptomyces sp. NPDC050164]|uniref:hypothetical protein n=1 Tax=Streptomyces sp. NPDC050164 TaxID=3365605 RepID=UPI0037AEB42B